MVEIPCEIRGMKCKGWVTLPYANLLCTYRDMHEGTGDWKLACDPCTSHGYWLPLDGPDGMLESDLAAYRWAAHVKHKLWFKPDRFLACVERLNARLPGPMKLDLRHAIGAAEDSFYPTSGEYRN